ncbi:uncharacterized protein LOC108984735 [Juglans regia]|uniref:Uncharacterized protein LOC108984735 n=1 Tax=Juglans regia TaxID=51240 RepID=A0A2I4DYY0_JUGRE|nr:uncharacterized protein LOC108984735 [Juglans regia]
MVHQIKPQLRKIKTYLTLFPNSLIKLLPQHHEPKYKSKESIPRTTMSVHRVPLSLILLLFLANMVSCNEAGVKTGSAQANGSMVPLIEAGKMEKMMMVMNETRRKLGSFQICALCTCCGGAKGLCLPSPCCYAINCNIPNRPFGFCSFTPKTCNCFGCHL